MDDYPRGYPRYLPDQVGRCRWCGFLGYRQPTGPGMRWAVNEIPLDMREPSFTPQWGYCFVWAYDLLAELEQAWVARTAQGKLPEDPFEQSRMRTETMSSIVGSDRHCEQWWPYVPNLTPAEHRQERDMLRLEQDRREFQKQLTTMEMEIHRGSQKIQADSLDIAKALGAANRESGKFTTKWTYLNVLLVVVALVVAMASLVVAIVALGAK